VLVDETAVWIGARMFDSEPGTIARQVVRRDQDAQPITSSGLRLNRDRRTGFLFRVGAANVQRDEYIFDDAERDRAARMRCGARRWRLTRWAGLQSCASRSPSFAFVPPTPSSRGE
jgi:hypothetical protein